jgi:hypothetical protein
MNKKNPSGLKWINTKELDPGEVAFLGPIRTPQDATETSLMTTVIMADTTLSSDTSGNITTVFTSSPATVGGGVTLAPGWSGLAGSWDEYRTLGYELTYVPFDKYNRGVSVFTVPLVAVADYDSSSPLLNYVSADQYSSQKYLSLDEKWTYSVRMSGIENSEFTSTAAPFAFYWLKLFGTGATVSTAYGKLFIRYRVQFRGRGV